MGRPRGTNSNLKGLVFGRLTVIERASDRSTDSKPRVRWVCLCECGGTTESRTDALTSGKATSCGCWHLEEIGHRKKTHGESGNQKMSPEYRAWLNMRRRCEEGFKARHRYFDRGISVCPEWSNDFEAFLGHVGRRPSPDLSLDRIDNDRGYEPGNVRWTTWDVQMSNRECNKPLFDRIADLEQENADLRAALHGKTSAT